MAAAPEEPEELAEPPTDLEAGQCGAANPRGREVSVRVACLLAVFLCRLEVSVLTLVIPLIAQEFDRSLEFTAWVVFLPEFTGTMFSPSVGKFADMYGHATTWRSGLLMIAVATWLCGWSPSLWLLLAARALTGFANSAVFAPALPLMAQGMDAERRGVMQSYIAAVDALGSSTGVLVGGMMVDHLSWRWIFLAPAPMLTLVWLSSWHLVPGRPGSAGPITGSAPAQALRSPLREFDWLGTFLFATMSFCALFGLNRGNDLGWHNPIVVSLLVAAGVQAPLLALVELRSPHPVLPIWMFFTPVRLLFTVNSALTWACYGSCFLLVPIYMQDALGMRPGTIGDILSVRPVAASIVAACMSRAIERRTIPMRRLAVAGACVQVASYSILNVANLLPLGATFYVLMELQLVLQAVGAFGTALPTVAMFVADLPEGELANASAMRGVVIGICSLFLKASNLSLIRFMGGEAQPHSYQPTWLLLVVLQVVVMATTCAVPPSAELRPRQSEEHPEGDVALAEKASPDADAAETTEPLRPVVLGKPADEEKPRPSGPAAAAVPLEANCEATQLLAAPHQMSPRRQ